MVSVKDIDVLTELLAGPYHTKLVDVLRWLESLYPGRMTITSGYRKHDTGIHGTIPCRAIDLRSRNYTNPRKIEEHINETYIYDPERPELRVAVIHDSGQGTHLHLQTCARTIRRVHV